MRGFKIVYLDVYGRLTDTWYSVPITNIRNAPDALTMAQVMFSYAHPDCRIVSISRCSYDDYKCR